MPMVETKSLAVVQRVILTQWYHVAATYDGNGHMKIFVNGREDSNRSESPLTILYTALPFRISRLSNIDPKVPSYVSGLLRTCEFPILLALTSPME